MRKILLVKTSSMGDVIHNLPVVTDVIRHFPDACIDWVVEKNFADIPALHPSVHRVIPIALRQWRKHIFARNTWRAVQSCKQALQLEHYDAVLDTQGLIKSALVTRWARGAKFGYDRSSAREAMASMAYDKKISVDKNLHAVERNRLLAARAFGYTLDQPVDYGIASAPLCADWLPQKKYLVLLHATSRADKEWPEANWVALGKYLCNKNLMTALPWGNALEKHRALRLAAAIPHAVVTPALSLRDAAGLISGAEAIVGVDTGLTHLAAALNKPVVAIYCASSPGLTGVYGGARAVNLGEQGKVPSLDDAIANVEIFI